MSDQAVAELLRSDNPLVVIEASAGCGKTHQGAEYAKDIAGSFGSGRLLILTHTHAACSVFGERTKGSGAKVDIRTIDALIAGIATAYHKPLGLPSNLASWAWQNDGEGFDIMAAKVAAFLTRQPMVAKALARRYPVVICDEHQDSSADQHAIVMALHHGGAKLRVFSDPLQRIYGRKKTDKAARIDKERWSAFKQTAACEKLDYPHRWKTGCPELGKWILSARQCLKNGVPIDLTGTLPASLTVLPADNLAPHRRGYQLSKDQRRPINNLVENTDQIMILASQNDLVGALRAFWWRSIPIWEGHTRKALAGLVAVLREKSGDAEALADGLVAFVGTIAVGCSRSSHGDRLCQEVREGCASKTRGKPANIQAIARCILDDPTHVGVAAALAILRDLIDGKQVGFNQIMVDNRVEFRDAIRLGLFADPDEAFAEIARKRSYAKPSPPARVLSTIHKAKGLECDNAMVMACDDKQFTSTYYARCKMYVAISRAKRSLTLVVPTTNPSPLFKVRIGAVTG